jgi:hypothetical protein
MDDMYILNGADEVSVDSHAGAQFFSNNTFIDDVYTNADGIEDNTARGSDKVTPVEPLNDDDYSVNGMTS